MLSFAYLSPEKKDLKKQGGFLLPALRVRVSLVAGVLPVL